jgi:hypothetical protein
MNLWKWVGSIIGIYGLLAFSMGVYYIFRPETITATAKYNPSLWWGFIMLVFSGILFLFSKKDERTI